MTDLYSALVAGLTLIVAQTANALAPVIAEYAVKILVPQILIWVAMILFKIFTKGLKKSKWHDQIYTAAPLVFGVIFVFAMRLFGKSFGFWQSIAIGLVLGGVSVLIYKVGKFLLRCARDRLDRRKTRE